MKNEITKEDIDLYAKWILSGRGNPLLEIHFLWEYLHTPNKNESLSKDDELQILKKYLELEGVI